MDNRLKNLMLFDSDSEHMKYERAQVYKRIGESLCLSG